MRFQFLCPNGHLLEADITHAGMRCECPHCDILFVIPSASIEPCEAPADQADAPLPGDTGEIEIPQIETVPEIGPPESEEESLVVVETDSITPPPIRESADPEFVHVPCPKGHELRTPVEMLGQEALCPFCKARFQLRYEDSREYRAERARAEALREEKLGRLWLTWAIIAAVAVLGGFILMIVASTQ